MQMTASPPASRANRTNAVRAEASTPGSTKAEVASTATSEMTSHQALGRPSDACSHEPRNTTTAARVIGAENRDR
jgi:hypothetical protein